MNKNKVFAFLKKIRPFIGLIFFMSLILLSTAAVFLSVASIFIYPLLWVVFMHTVAQGAVDKSYGIHVGKLAGLPHPVVKRAEQILKKLEVQNAHTTTIVDDLPLFSAVLNQEQKEKSQAEEYLDSINPDDLTPKQALETLYELKKLSN